MPCQQRCVHRERQTERAPALQHIAVLPSVCNYCVPTVNLTIMRTQVHTVAGSSAWHPLHASCCDRGFAATSARVSPILAYPRSEHPASQSSNTRSFAAKAPKLKPYSSYRERFRTSADGLIKFQRPGHRHRRFRKRYSCNSNWLRAACWRAQIQRVSAYKRALTWSTMNFAHCWLCPIAARSEMLSCGKAGYWWRPPQRRCRSWVSFEGPFDALPA